MIYNPLEQFEIHYYFIVLNNFNWVLIILLLILLTSLTATVTNSSLFIDSITDLVGGLTKEDRTTSTFVFVLFALLLTTNVLGIMPIGLAISSQLVYTIIISLGIIIGTTLLGLVSKGWVFWLLFLPHGAPLPILIILFFIELMSYCSRAISLGLRLGANTLSGHLLVDIVAALIFSLGSISIVLTIIGSVLFLLLTAIYLLEIAIAFIQAYVFTILLVNYITDIKNIH